MIRRLALAALVLACCVAVARAQRPTTGSGRISGVVVTADQAATPVRRAVVTLVDSSMATRAEISDDAGRFVFVGVPAGQFTLTAVRNGFIKAAYGAKRPGRPGTSVPLGDGQSIDNLRLYMARGAAISGTIRSRTGEPLPGVQVVAFRQGETVSPLSALSIRGSRVFHTDDRGVYRIFGLEPGKYFVAALPQVQGASEVRLLTERTVDSALANLQQQRPIPPPPGDERLYGYLPLYYPGTPRMAAATPISIDAGDDRGGVDIALELIPVTTIEGRIVGPDGAPAGASLSMATETGVPISFAGAPQLALSPRAGEGRFRYVNVAPGEYTLTARVAGSLWARAQVNVAGDAVKDVVLTLQPGLSVSGRVEFDAQSLPPPQDLAQARITLRPLDPGSGSAAMNATVFGRNFPASGTAAADGTFELRNVLPDTYLVGASLPATPASAGWRLRSVMFEGRDLLDEPWAMRAADARGLVITFTDRQTELTGMLQTASAQPAVEYFVVVVPADRKFWTPASRRVKVARPALDGRFSFRNLPAGDYVLAALDDVDPSTLADADVLEQIVRGGLKVTLAEGASVVQDVRIR